MVSISLARGGAEPDSDRAKRIAKLKRELVLQLFFKQGDFWHAVKEARGRLGREGKIGTAHHGGQNLSVVFAMDSLDWSELGNKVRASIFEEMAKLKKRMIPHSLDDEFLLREWTDFLVLCILYDPPADELVEFSEYGGPTRVFAGGERTEEKHKRGGAPSVRYVRDPFQTEVQRLAQISKVCDEIEKAHPDIRAWDLIEERGLLEQFRLEMERIPRRFHIEVAEDTTAKDVTDAYRAIKAASGFRNPGGKPPIDRLVAVQCASLYDDRNGIDPDDRRRRLWTYKKLATKFRSLGVKNKRSAEEHVKRGRELRKKFRSP